MDPASFSFAVIGMFMTCCKGYRVLSDGCNAPADARNAARRLRIEYSVLEVWGMHWQIGNDPQQARGKKRFEDYLMRPHVLDGVFDALCAISETFTDIADLNKKYGVVFTYQAKADKSPHIPQEIQNLLDGRETKRRPSAGGPEKLDERMKRELSHYQRKMSLLERCRWSLRGKNNIQELIGTFRRHNEDLVRLCPWEAQGQINRGLADVALPQSKNSVELHLMADSAEEAAKDKVSPLAEGRQRIGRLARFKAKVMAPTIVSGKYRPRWRLLNQEDYHINSSRHPYTFGEHLRNKDPVFIEWQSYRDLDGRPSRRAENQIHDLGDFLAVSDRPHDFRTLECIGLFKDQANDRYGVVYNLPEHLRNLPHTIRKDSRQIFNPQTLTQLMENVEQMLDLGVRFDLARKLVTSVGALHTCGWLHRNIRSDNIFFFQPRPKPGEEMKGHRRDIGRPFIVGSDLSRRDDIADEGAKSKRVPNMSRPDGNVEPSVSRPDSDSKTASFNIYRHPDKIADPMRRFRHSYDIYSLGLVLLEIGLWQDLQSLDASRWKDGYALRKYVLQRLVPDLAGQCGSIYGGVVKDCLTMESGDVAEEGQRKLAWGIADRLDQCVA